MINALTAPLSDYEITSEKTSEILEQAFDEILSPETKVIAIYKKYILRECEKITEPFIDLMSYYTSRKNEENFEQIVKAFLTYYEDLTNKFGEIIKSNSYNKYTCCLITLVWLDVLANLEKRAKADGNFIVRNIALQLQTDINYAVEILYPEPEKVNS